MASTRAPYVAFRWARFFSSAPLVTTSPTIAEVKGFIPPPLSNSPLLAGLRAQGFYAYVRQADDLPWSTVGYQHLPNADRTPYPLRAEIGPLGDYLTEPTAHTGPDPASLPAEVRDHPERYLLVALRPSDFNCNTPL